MPKPFNRNAADPDEEKIQLKKHLDHVEQRANSTITSIAIHGFEGDPHGDPHTFIFGAPSGSSGSPALKTKPPANS